MNLTNWAISPASPFLFYEHLDANLCWSFFKVLEECVLDFVLTLVVLEAVKLTDVLLYNLELVLPTIVPLTTEAFLCGAIKT